MRSPASASIRSTCSSCRCASAPDAKSLRLDLELPARGLDAEALRAARADVAKAQLAARLVDALGRRARHGAREHLALDLELVTLEVRRVALDLLGAGERH